MSATLGAPDRGLRRRRRPRAARSRRSSRAAPRRRSSGPTASTSARDRGARRRRHDGRLRRRDRDGRPHVHGAARPADGGVLPPRELRQVHALPRGHALGRRDAAPHRGGHRPPRRDRPPARRSATTSRASACARSATRCAMPVRAFVKRFREEFDEHVRQGGCTCPRRRACASLYPQPEAPAPPGGGSSHERNRRRHRHASRSTGARSIVPKGTPLVLAAAANGVEIPIFCYEPRLGARGRRLPHVPRRGRGHAEAAGRLHDDRDRRHEGAHAQRARPSDARRRCSSSS